MYSWCMSCVTVCEITARQRIFSEVHYFVRAILKLYRKDVRINFSKLEVTTAVKLYCKTIGKYVHT